MAVIAVGDFDPASRPRATSSSSFAALPRSPAAGERPRFPVPDHQETLVAVAKDRELPGTSVGVLYKLPRAGRRLRAGLPAARRGGHVPPHDQRPPGGADPQRRSPLSVRRLGDPALRPGHRRLPAGGGGQAGRDRPGAAGADPRGRADRPPRLYQAGELEREKAELLRELERAVKEKDKVPSATLADEMIRHYLRQEGMPGIERELALTREFLPTVTLPEMNRVASEWIAERNRVILVQAPEDGAGAARRASCGPCSRRSRRRRSPPTSTRWRRGPWWRPLPRPGPVRQERQIPEVGVTEWRLANGVRVVVKPTDFRNDQILVRGLQPGRPLAGARPGLPLGPLRRRPGGGQRGGRASGRPSCARPWRARRWRWAPSSTSWRRGSSARPRPTTSRPCSSSSTST